MMLNSLGKTHESFSSTRVTVRRCVCQAECCSKQTFTIEGFQIRVYRDVYKNQGKKTLHYLLEARTTTFACTANHRYIPVIKTYELGVISVYMHVVKVE